VFVCVESVRTLLRSSETCYQDLEFCDFRCRFQSLSTSYLLSLQVSANRRKLLRFFKGHFVFSKEISVFVPSMPAEP
jgi:hypothetical protein